MRKIIFVLITTAVLSWCQGTESKPTVSEEPLNAEQIAIYRGFLEIYSKGSDTPLNVANITDPLDYSPAEIKEGKGCLKGISLESVQRANSVVHRLDPAVANGLSVRLVDPERQIKIVKQNDPQKALRRGDKQLDKTLDTAFATGLFTFSEIAFDKKHQVAILTFSFYCGSLCGHGGVLLFRKVGKKWKLTKRDCGSWIS